MIGYGFLIAVGPALTVAVLSAIAAWALTHEPRRRRGR